MPKKKKKKHFCKAHRDEVTQDVQPNLDIYVTKELKRRTRDNRRLASP